MRWIYELGLSGVLIATVLAARSIKFSWLVSSVAGVRGGFRWLTKRRSYFVASVGLAALGLNMFLSLVVRMPVPAIHDEFSYLLAADTFAHGRLTNPTHPMWRHFESWHIIHKPSYQSKYPPGQGLALALGQVVFCHPIVGVWISHSLACAAVCWMLQAWMPSRWALLGGLLVIINPELLARWGQGYWGGAVAMLGGALVFGALRRILRRPRAWHALTLGVGLALLANSRPYEGLVASLPAIVVLLVWVFRKTDVSFRLFLTRVALPVAGVLIPTIGCMAYYNFRVTDSPLRLPYAAWKDTYTVGRSLSATLFFWHPAKIEVPREERSVRRTTARIQDLPDELKERSPVQQTIWVLQKLAVQWQFYLGVLLTIPLFMVSYVLRNRWMQFAVFTIALVMLALVLEQNRGYRHYTAPITGLVIAVVVQGMRHLRHVHLGGAPTGRVLVRSIPLACLASFLFFCGTVPDGVAPWCLKRARILRILAADSDRHLVIVRYSQKHKLHNEWVYNEADIDNAKVVWARELEPRQNEELLAYFHDRRVWLVEADAKPPKRTPYTRAGQSSGTVQTATRRNSAPE